MSNALKLSPGVARACRDRPHRAEVLYTGSVFCLSFYVILLFLVIFARVLLHVQRCQF